MKHIIAIVFFLFIYLPHSNSQPYSEWTNYSFSRVISGIGINGNDIWVSTQGGLVKYNKITGEKSFYNRANASLPDNNLSGMFCDTNGDVWVAGSYYGIGKFTGEQCTIYNEENSGLPCDTNTQIKIDKNGNVWIASLHWMVKYDGVSWKKWETGHSASSYRVISGFDFDENNVTWIYSTDGIGKIENDEYTIISDIGSDLIAKVGCVKVDNEQNVWIAVKNQGLYKYDGTEFINYSTSNSCLTTNTILDISFDLQNKMWLGSTEGLLEFSTSNCTVHSTDGVSVFRIEATNNDTVWCGTVSGKLLCFDGIDFSSIDVSSSPLQNNFITDIFIDNDNNKWIGTKKNVALKTDTQFYSAFEKPVNAITQDKDGAMWFAFSQGDTSLLKVGSNETTVFDSVNSPFGKNKAAIYSMLVDNENLLWIASNKGIYTYNGSSFENYNTTNSLIPSNYIGLIVSDNNDNIWGALNIQSVSKGIFKFDRTSWTNWNTSNSAIPSNTIFHMDFDSSNKLWFTGSGLTRFDGQSMITFNTGNSFTDLFIDKDDKIWVATDWSGLMSFDRINNWTLYDVTNSGMAHNRIRKVNLDKSGNLWLGHYDAGISIFVTDTLGLSLNSFKEQNQLFQLFPNPVENELYIKFNDSGEKYIQANIYDLSGRLIINFPGQLVEANSLYLQFELNNQLKNSGVYVLSISSDSNVFNEKFIFKK